MEEVLSQLVQFRVPNQMMKGSQLREEKTDFEQLVKIFKT